MNITKMGELNKLSPGLLTLVTVLPFIVFSYFYISYAFGGWFFLDDFGFISEYGNSLAINQLFDLSNFGRFISRNVYWFLGWKFFGDNATFYFIFNFFLLSSCSFLVYKIFELRQGANGAMISSLLYFCSPAVIVAYIWISNSQHLLGHLFVFLFVFYYLRFKTENITPGRAACLLFILTAGLLSNIFVGLILSLPAWFMLTTKEARMDRYHWVISVAGAVLFLFIIIKLKQHNFGAYSMNISLDTLIINTEYYFLSVWIFLCWLIASFVGAFMTWRAGRLFESWLFIASPGFFAPYAFLAEQRYPQYAALTYLFFLLGVWALFHIWAEHKGTWLIGLGGGLVASGLMLVSLALVQHFNFIENPRGVDQKKLISQLRSFNLSGGKDILHYCFNPITQYKGGTRVIVMGIRREWWFLGFGKAFSLFVDPLKTYQLTNDGGPCDATFLIDGRRLVQQIE